MYFYQKRGCKDFPGSPAVKTAGGSGSYASIARGTSSILGWEAKIAQAMLHGAKRNKNKINKNKVFKKEDVPQIC